jgi:prepilin-type N-terminal cleavage/methylation domain-containing protein
MFNYLKQINKKDTSVKFTAGFTLVETLVAIAIFSMSILGLMTVLAKGIADTNYAKFKTTASFLAEEGIEYVRNIRDTYVLNDSSGTVAGWSKFITAVSTPCVPASGRIGCKFNDELILDFSNLINTGNNIFTLCANQADCTLYYDDNKGKYSYTPGVSFSGFTRVITVATTSMDPLKEIRVTSTVSWSRNSVPYSVSFSDNLLKWKE